MLVIISIILKLNSFIIQETASSPLSDKITNSNKLFEKETQTAQTNDAVAGVTNTSTEAVETEEPSDLSSLSISSSQHATE